MPRKEFFFHIVLSLLTVLIVIGILKACCLFIVYGKGIYLQEIDPSYYATLTAKDPPYQFRRDFYQFHPATGWAQTPDNEGWFRGFSYPRAEFRIPVKINSQGFHSREEFIPDPQKLRIAVLGDSFVQALQVKEEENLTSRLQENFSADGIKTQVFNFGLSSIGTAHEYKIFQADVLKVQPQIVLLLFFPNDLIDDSPFYSHESNVLVPEYVLKSDGGVEVLDFTARESDHIVTYEFSSGRQQTENKALFFKHFLFPELFDLLSKDRYGPLDDYSAAFDVYKKEYPAELKDSLSVTVKLLKQMHAECVSRNIKFFVVLVPAKEQAEPGTWDHYLRLRSRILDENQFDIAMPQKQMKQSLTGTAIPVLDLLADFQKESRQKVLYYREDLHFNPQGHDLAAKAITEFLYQNDSTLRRTP